MIWELDCGLKEKAWYTSEYANVHMTYVREPEGQKLPSGVFLNHTLPCVLRQDLSLTLKLTDGSIPAGQREPPVLGSPRLGLQAGRCCYTQSFCELRFSCFRGRYFAEPSFQYTVRSCLLVCFVCFVLGSHSAVLPLLPECCTP